MDELQQLQTTMRGCRICLEAGYSIVPGAVFQGNSGARVMIIGQAPGITEVEAKRPFNAGSGRSGKRTICRRPFEAVELLL